MDLNAGQEGLQLKSKISSPKKEEKCYSSTDTDSSSDSAVEDYSIKFKKFKNGSNKRRHQDKTAVSSDEEMVDSKEDRNVEAKKRNTSKSNMSIILNKYEGKMSENSAAASWDEERDDPMEWINDWTMSSEATQSKSKKVEGKKV